ncbi:MAG: aminotransferase class III-fold pyridoxal phosphate-dependent enzyme [archaeon]
MHVSHGKKSQAIIRRDHKLMSPSYDRHSGFVYKRAKGCYLWDLDGHRFLDFAAGIAVMNAGHSNPEVVAAIKKQLKFGLHAAFPDFYAELPVRFSERLVSFLPRELNKVFLSNSGTESVEAAFKLARWHSKKKWAVAFTPSFHGRTMGSLSMTNSNPVARARFEPFLPVKHVPYPYIYRFKNEDEGECANHSLNAIERVFKKHNGNVASIFFEPICGEGGYIVPPKDFARGVRRLCDEYGVIFCVDEVQSGCFRAGKFLAISNFGVVPDIVSLSKAIGGGVPLGATIAKKEIMDWGEGVHSNTFGGNLLACAAGVATLDFLKKKRLGQNAVKVGNMMLKVLNEMKEEIEIIGDVRGIGLMIGVEVVKSKKSKEIDEKLLENVLLDAGDKGLLLLHAGKNVIRICPPLVLSEKQAMVGLEILGSSLKKFG